MCIRDRILSDKFTCSSDDKKLYVYFIYDGDYREYIIDTSRSNTWNKDAADWLDFGFEQSYSEVEGTTKEQYQQRRSEIPGEIRPVSYTHLVGEGCDCRFDSFGCCGFGYFRGA